MGEQCLVQRFHKCVHLADGTFDASGLVGCILGLISSYNEMSKVKDFDEKDRHAFTVFSRLQFWLGVLEGFMLVLEIGFEAFGLATASMVCGVLGVGKLSPG